ncbi:Retrovirus-related Pol polyprotein from transposon TNT 1-94 [Abeliophyllum distichum]|uniref:Retrovirus-related Pol polyprotein from transposon TNT 1-94 n=1 Tax=Abeliophyllum distichum TaxID=126358 RepID=A0ABD1REG7_9LAMI
MFFYLTTLNLARVLTEDAPKLNAGEGDIQTVSAVEAWKHSDFRCRSYVMNGLADSLYNGYSSMKMAKELLEYLDHKYKIEDAGTKKFIVGRFFYYKMVDSKIHDQLCIEEDNKGSERKMFNSVVAKANVVEHGQSSKVNKNKFGKGPKMGLKGGKDMFSCFEATENGEKLFIENSVTFKIKGQGKVVLKMTSEKEPDS